MTIAVTGADGFIGTSLCSLLDKQGRAVTRIVRRAEGTGADRRVVPDLATAPLERALAGASAVVHLAARAHVLREPASDPDAEFYRANVEGSLRLAHAAAQAGARRLVFVSSIGVHGNSTDGVPLTESDPPAPVDPYAISKLRAERVLATFAAEQNLELVILRPPMVYGAGAKGNFLRLLRWVDSGLPLPLARVANRRNLIGVENLCDLIALSVGHDAAAGQVFLAAEPDVHSTPGLIRSVARALGRRSHLFPVPVAALELGARISGRGELLQKLCGSLEVSGAKATNLLGWRPNLSFDEGIDRAVSWFNARADGLA
jgi:nucleoside-diphosphate-sugar epimerase